MTPDMGQKGSLSSANDSVEQDADVLATVTGASRDSARQLSDSLTARRNVTLTENMKTAVT